MSVEHLIQAIYAGDEERVATLLTRDDLVNETRADGQIPLHAAMRDGNVEIVKLLLHAGANPDARDAESNSALHLAASSSRSNPALVEVLINRGAQINARDKYGNTPLHIAALLARQEFALELVRAGASIDLKDGGGRTPVRAAPRSLAEMMRRVYKDSAQRRSPPHRQP